MFQIQTICISALLLGLFVLPSAAFFSFNKLGSTSSSSSAIDKQMSANGVKYPIICDESVMSEKAHGTTATGVQKDLRWNCDQNTADRICSYNRHYAEHSGYWEGTTFLAEADKTGETQFYDSVTGKLLYMAPRGRSFADFQAESKSHGWPSFRDNEVNWDEVRCLSNGECVSKDGTHLGHNLPDRNGNRYCINLVCVAGKPVV
mmetsp:Transcript_28660/g.27461  ORF Transcript_28660/g.27461 Transcript_28660/m.27461 type:complete len:204 (+) Transcript_28660:68-679(+)